MEKTNIGMSELRDKIAELLRFEHATIFMFINPATASIEAYYPIADAILDIEVERDCPVKMHNMCLKTIAI